MARKAIRTVVDIVAHRAMFRVHRRFVVRMARNAGKDSEVRRIGVAIGARGPFTLVRA